MGVSLVTMHSERLAFDFPNLVPNDLPVVQQIIQATHDAFPKAFAELDYERADILAPARRSTPRPLRSCTRLSAVAGRKPLTR